MQNGPDLAKRFYKDLTDIQVRWGGGDGVPSFLFSSDFSSRFLLFLSVPLSTDAQRATGHRWLFKLFFFFCTSRSHRWSESTRPAAHRCTFPASLTAPEETDPPLPPRPKRILLLPLKTGKAVGGFECTIPEAQRIPTEHYQKTLHRDPLQDHTRSKHTSLVL